MPDLRFDTMTDLLVRQAEQLYDAEHRLTDLLSRISRRVENAAIAETVRAYNRETESGMVRLRKVFYELGTAPKRSPCQTVEGAVANCKDLFDAPGSQSVKEMAFLSALQGIQNYEIALLRASYSLAARLSMKNAAQLLQRSLEAKTSDDLKAAAVMRTLNLRFEM